MCAEISEHSYDSVLWRCLLILSSPIHPRKPVSDRGIPNWDGAVHIHHIFFKFIFVLGILELNQWQSLTFQQPDALWFVGLAQLEMRFAVLLWFLGSNVNGPVAWLWKRAPSATPLLWLKEGDVPENRWNMFSVTRCLPLPCHWHLGDAFFAKQGFLYLQRLLLWVRFAGFEDCLMLPAEWKWGILTGKHFFKFYFFHLWWNSHVISLLSQWLMLNFYAINFSLSSAFISDGFIHSIFQTSFLKCEEES